eukprot:TRINITY_DN1972_c1_g1_i1.p2 TRINITY_DN1972_c1_g1~~TRINITY_DN1972_c1_g1_i1.p2  ORF type:complete len:382 (-),score=14.92 TRINITY_DN1972_c1_g1_i1:658-1803(-)
MENKNKSDSYENGKQQMYQQFKYASSSNQGVGAYTSEVEVAKCLSEIFSWNNFDVFRLNELTQGNALVVVSMEILHRLGLVQSLKLSNIKLQSFLTDIQNSYLDNPYHNSMHAADVVQSIACLIVSDYENLFVRLTNIEVFALIFSGIIHDVGHPGVSNDFLVNTQADLALIYNDQSVNENMHLSRGFFMLLKPENNFISHWDKCDYLCLRKLVISIVLATDMSRHIAHVSSVQNFKDVRFDVETLLQICLHCADLGNIAKIQKFCGEWSRRIAHENLLQGEMERSRGLKVNADCNTYNLAECQANFLISMKPFFFLFQQIAPSLGRTMVSNLETNILEWKKIIVTNDRIQTIGSNRTIDLDQFLQQANSLNLQNGWNNLQ